MNKRNAALGVTVAVVVAAAIGFPHYLNWWNHHSCSESGGTWNQAQDACIEPQNADIPNTEGSAAFEDDHQGGDKPRE